MFLHEESAIDDKTAKRLKDQVINTKYILTYTQYALLGVGGTMILYAIALIVIYASDRHEKLSYEQFVDDKEPKESIYQPSWFSNYDYVIIETESNQRWSWRKWLGPRNMFLSNQ